MDRTELTATEQGRLRRVAVVAIVLAVSAIGIAVLLAPSSRIVEAPVVPTDRPVPPTPDTSVLEDELAKFDCGPDCYGETLKHTPKP